MPPTKTVLRSRPTAVNLADSAIKLKAIARTVASAPGATPSSVVEAVVAASEGFLAEDIASNRVSNIHGEGARKDR